MVSYSQNDVITVARPTRPLKTTRLNRAVALRAMANAKFFVKAGRPPHPPSNNSTYSRRCIRTDSMLRGGLAFKTHRRLHLSTLGSRVIKRMKKHAPPRLANANGFFK